MEKLISIGETAEILGVSVSTLRRWEKEGKLEADHRTFGIISQKYSISSTKNKTNESTLVMPELALMTKKKT